MKIISKQIEDVEFSRIIEGNTSETLGTLPVEILTIEVESFNTNGFESPEYPCTVTRRVVCVDGRYFAVGRATCDTKTYWNSVTLPVGMDPRPKPREWDMIVGNDGGLYRPEQCFHFANSHKIRVREVLD